MPHFLHEGFRFNYELSGSGPRLLFCNGSGASIRSSLPMLSQWRAHFEVGVHDQRGLGETGLRVADPDGTREDSFSMADYANDALALADHLGWSSFNLIGVSFGGMVAQELAVTAPERVERLALLCTSAGGEGGSSFPLHTLPSLPADEQRALALSLLDNRFTPEWLAAHPNDDALVKMRSAHASRVRTRAEQTGERRQLEARMHHNVWERLSLITSPTMVTCGAFDDLAPPTNGRAIASRVKGARFASYQGGHLFFVQDPRAVPDIRDFLLGQE